MKVWGRAVAQAFIMSMPWRHSLLYTLLQDYWYNLSLHNFVAEFRTCCHEHHFSPWLPASRIRMTPTRRADCLLST